MRGNFSPKMKVLKWISLISHLIDAKQKKSTFFIRKEIPDVDICPFKRKRERHVRKDIDKTQNVLTMRKNYFGQTMDLVTMN